MKKLIILIIMVLGLTGCSQSSLQNETKYTEPNLIEYEELETKLNNKDSFVLLLWQTGCSHCESFEPRLSNVIKKYNIQVYSINLAEVTETEYAKIENKTFVKGTPTTVYFKEGKVQSTKLVGDKSEDDIVEFLKKYEVIK